jgi:hypothetical protein
LSGDESFAEIESWLVNHMLSEIQDDGEFIYYHVYLDKRVDRERNRGLFSFFYPGEALCGLVAYYKNSASADEKVLLKTKIQSGLQILGRRATALVRRSVCGLAFGFLVDDGDQ